MTVFFKVNTYPLFSCWKKPKNSFVNRHINIAKANGNRYVWLRVVGETRKY